MERILRGGKLRTQDEIVQKVIDVQASNEDWLGTMTNDLLVYLSYENAKPFLQEDSTKEKWLEVEEKLSDELIRKDIKEYMEFAWEKANNFRGISAGRSMDHYTIWLWLLDIDLGELRDYNHYGKDELIKICIHFGLDHTQWDDGVRLNEEPS